MDEMSETRRNYQEAEATQFPPVDSDVIWCSVRGLMVGVSECVSGCAAPEQRPVCWLGHQRRVDQEEPIDTDI